MHGRHLFVRDGGRLVAADRAAVRIVSGERRPLQARAIRRVFALAKTAPQVLARSLPTARSMQKYQPQPSALPHRMQTQHSRWLRSLVVTLLLLARSGRQEWAPRRAGGRFRATAVTRARRSPASRRWSCPCQRRTPARPRRMRRRGPGATALPVATTATARVAHGRGGCRDDAVPRAPAMTAGEPLTRNGRRLTSLESAGDTPARRAAVHPRTSDSQPGRRNIAEAPPRLAGGVSSPPSGPPDRCRCCLR